MAQRLDEGGREEPAGMGIDIGAAASRRSVLAAGAAVAMGAPLAIAGLAGCTVYEQPGGFDDEPEPSANAGNSPTPFATTTDIPVGGGAVFEQRRVVVTQPTEGTFKAFSAVCTHQGCVVADVRDGKITCPCHGSQFSIDDGAVITGPATRAIRERAITISGTDITLA